MQAGNFMSTKFEKKICTNTNFGVSDIALTFTDQKVTEQLEKKLKFKTKTMKSFNIQGIGKSRKDSIFPKRDIKEQKM